MTHQFKVGDQVRLREGFLDRTNHGLYEVVRLLPESGGKFGYRIKSPNDLTERAVREEELRSAA